jgi:hypothetical protein
MQVLVNVLEDVLVAVEVQGGMVLFEASLDGTDVLLLQEVLLQQFYCLLVVLITILL